MIILQLDFLIQFIFKLITRVYIGELKNTFLKLNNDNLNFQYKNYLMNLETKKFK